MTAQIPPLKTAGEYAAKAEGYVRDSERAAPEGAQTRRIARAQVYATLALAAATQETS